ncbi:N-acetyltransferase [Stappia sp. F7233]|uniref:N-acetyltransferase n=1 Tax=Stappia albiluteola TaxID=2758565 RepID=A0A839ABD6_9HYPH|nr:N-acetyltransferase [Stappia albiluteola]MBA5776217.1 N-acetyltransferase [Stappia albiluteola]
MRSSIIDGKGDIRVREANPSDRRAIHAVVSAAFGQPVEADLVDRLRDCGALVVDYVAEDATGRMVGHAAASRVTGAGQGHRLAITCLAPVSVLPDLQRSGIGSKLIRQVIEDLKEKDEDLILVLGDPAYYPRFGFDAGLARLVKAPYAGDAFMALALSEAALTDLPVEVTFATPFEAFE